MKDVLIWVVGTVLVLGGATMLHDTPTAVQGMVICTALFGVSGLFIWRICRR